MFRRFFWNPKHSCTKWLFCLYNKTCLTTHNSHSSWSLNNVHNLSLEGCIINFHIIILPILFVNVKFESNDSLLSYSIILVTVLASISFECDNQYSNMCTNIISYEHNFLKAFSILIISIEKMLIFIEGMRYWKVDVISDKNQLSVYSRTPGKILYQHISLMIILQLHLNSPDTHV